MANTQTMENAGSLHKDSIMAVPARLKLAWGTGALGANILVYSIAGLGLLYMIEVLNIEPAVAGALLSITKLVDVFTDPLVGIWSDRIKTPIGRRRPFLLPGAILSVIAFVMFFTAPNFEQQAFVIGYLFFALVVYTVGYTLFNVPYMSMPAEMTDSYHERSSIHAYRVVFVNIGGLISGAVAPFALEEMGKSEASSYAVLGIAGGSIIFIAMAVTFVGTKKARFKETGNTAPDILAEFKAVAANKHFLRLVSVKVVQLMALTVTGSAMYFFMLNTLQLDLKAKSYFFLCVTATSLIAAPLLVKLSRKIGKSRAYMVSASCYILYALSWIFAGPGEPLILILIRGLIVGISATGNVLLAMSMLTDTIEYDARVTNERREGAYTSIYSLIEKATFALGPAIVGGALSLAGYDQNLSVDDAQGPAVRDALMLSMAYIPAALTLLSVFILVGYKLDEKTLEKANDQS